MAILSFFLSPIGRYVAIGLAVIVALGGVWLHGDSNGSDRIQRKWDAAVQAAVERGEKARSDAERSIERQPAGRVQNDKYDRDQGAM